MALVGKLIASPSLAADEDIIIEEYEMYGYIKKNSLSCITQHLFGVGTEVL